MILATKELLDVVEMELYQRFKGAEDIDVLDFVDMKVNFDLKTDGVWVDGYVRVDYQSDMGVYIRWPNQSDYSYQFDILWCDILPEGVE